MSGPTVAVWGSCAIEEFHNLVDHSQPELMPDIDRSTTIGLQMFRKAVAL